jgi:hypothetical protein
MASNFSGMGTVPLQNRHVPVRPLKPFGSIADHSAAMDSLPQELLELVLLWNVRMSKCDKNEILPLRLVCKSFDDALKPYIFKTIPLEFSKFLRNAQTPDLRYLQDVGRLSQAVYLNMMVIRDEGMLESILQSLGSLG